RYLCRPEFASRSGHLREIAAVVVPKTAMHEDYNSISRQHDIRSPRQIAPVQAESQAARVESRPEAQLGCGVAAAHAAHGQAALFRCEDVNHVSTASARWERESGG